MNTHKSGFSLIELMVVFAIAAMLAVIALPSYRSYSIKARVLEKVVFAQDLLSSLTTYYQINNAFPPSISHDGNVIEKNTFWQVVSNSSMGLSGLMYAADDATGVVKLQLSFNDLEEIPGFIASSGNPEGEGRSSFVVAARQVSGGIMVKACGAAPYITQDIPMEYLPESCHCESVDNYQSTGSCS